MEDHSRTTYNTLLTHDLEEVCFSFTIDTGEFIHILFEEGITSHLLTEGPDGMLLVRCVAVLAANDHIVLDVPLVVIDSVKGEVSVELLVTTEASFVL